MRVFLVTPTSTVASYCSFNEKRKRDPSFFFLSARLHCNLYCIEVTIQSSSKKWRSKSSEAHKKSLYVMKVDRYLRSLAYNVLPIGKMASMTDTFLSSFLYFLNVVRCFLHEHLRLFFGIHRLTGTLFFVSMKHLKDVVRHL